MRRSCRTQILVRTRRCWVTMEEFGDSWKSNQGGDKIGLRVQKPAWCQRHEQIIGRREPRSKIQFEALENNLFKKDDSQASALQGRTKVSINETQGRKGDGRAWNTLQILALVATRMEMLLFNQTPSVACSSWVRVEQVWNLLDVGVCGQLFSWTLESDIRYEFWVWQAYCRGMASLGDS